MIEVMWWLVFIVSAKVIVAVIERVRCRVGDRNG